MLISWKERQCASSVRLRRTYNIHSFLFFQQLHCSEEPSDLCHSPQIPASDRRDGRLLFSSKVFAVVLSVAFIIQISSTAMGEAAL